MIVGYGVFPFKNGVIHRPVAQVKLVLGAKSFTTWGLLDSGCDRTLINKQVGKYLGVDFDNCNKSLTIGIGSLPETTWQSQIEIEVIGLNAGTRNSNISFIASKNVGILFGHIGFFEFYKIQFETYMKRYIIDIPS